MQVYDYGTPEGIEVLAQAEARSSEPFATVGVSSELTGQQFGIDDDDRILLSKELFELLKSKTFYQVYVYGTFSGIAAIGALNKRQDGKRKLVGMSPQLSGLQFVVRADDVLVVSEELFNLLGCANERQYVRVADTN